jgi:hypothetical protein
MQSPPLPPKKPRPKSLQTKTHELDRIAFLSPERFIHKPGSGWEPSKGLAATDCETGWEVL